MGENSTRRVAPTNRIGQMRRLALRGALAAAILFASCAHAPLRFDPSARPTCLVLSVGGPTGVALLGAAEAVRESGLKVDCVVGTSMGSLVGALYATAPTLSTKKRFVQLVREYVAETTSVAKLNAAGSGFFLGLVGAVLSGGALIPALLAGGVGAAVGADSTERLDRNRLVTVLDRALDEAKIESLPVQYATLYQQRERDGFVMVEARTGKLADAVGKSIANPLIFKNLNLQHETAIDPGADRIAAVPVEDACRMFPGRNLLVINASGMPATYRADLGCAVREVKVEIGDVSAEQVFALGREFEAAVAAGHDATLAALNISRTAPPPQ